MERSELEICFACIGLLALIGLSGCSNSLPAISPPSIDASSVADAAMKQYDADGDGLIDETELTAAPSLQFVADELDESKDGKISQEEIERFAYSHWVEKGMGIMRTRCAVTMNGRPLNDAIVTLEPEKFMGDAIHPAVGKLRNGNAMPDISDEHRPHPNAKGSLNGLYLVRISRIVDGKETIPARYNEQTELGCEIGTSASYLPGPLSFELKSR